MTKAWDSVAPDKRVPDNGLGVTSKITELEAEIERLRDGIQYSMVDLEKSHRRRDLVAEDLLALLDEKPCGH